MVFWFHNKTRDFQKKKKERKKGRKEGKERKEKEIFQFLQTSFVPPSTHPENLLCAPTQSDKRPLFAFEFGAQQVK